MKPEFVEHIKESEHWILTDFTRDGYKTVLVSLSAENPPTVTDAFILMLEGQDCGYHLKGFESGLVIFESDG